MPRTPGMVRIVGQIDSAMYERFAEFGRVGGFSLRGAISRIAEHTLNPDKDPGFDYIVKLMEAQHRKSPSRPSRVRMIRMDIELDKKLHDRMEVFRKLTGLPNMPSVLRQLADIAFSKNPQVREIHREFVKQNISSQKLNTLKL